MNNKDNYIPRLPVEIVLNSKFGTEINDLDGHKFYELESEIVARKDENIIIHLKKAFIPFSFYTLSSNQKNNKLDIIETQTGGTTNTYVITIPDGNYNITELLSTITTLLESETQFNYKYSITFNSINGKVSFLITSGTNALNSTLLFSSGSNVSNSCNRLLGFNNTDITFTTSSSATSQKVIDMADGLDSLHIKSNLVGQNTSGTVGDTGSSELLVIPIDLQPYNILYYDEGAEPFKHKISQSSIKRIEIKITNSRDKIVDFNGLPYTFILLAQFVFNPSSTLTIMNKSIDSEQALLARIATNNELADKILKKINNNNINEDSGKAK
tara:strand:- start:349 stop:1332 length:984 start_codon:yes stop_codon:yes gene_type:complete